MRKEIAPAVSLHYVQSTLQASATDTKHTTIVKNKQEQRWGLGSIPLEPEGQNQAEIWSPSWEGGPGQAGEGVHTSDFHEWEGGDRSDPACWGSRQAVGGPENCEHRSKTMGFGGSSGPNFKQKQGHRNLEEGSLGHRGALVLGNYCHWVPPHSPE